MRAALPLIVLLHALASGACMLGDGGGLGPYGDAGPDARRADAGRSDARAPGLDAGGCTSSARDCTSDPRAPVCDPVRGRCVACTRDDDRCDPADHCDTATDTCAPGCHSDDGCALPAPHCDAAVHQCVECTRGDQCPIGTTCAGGRCTPGNCPAGTADCNRNMADGCEANLATDPNNCGACGASGTESCNARDDNCNGRCDDLDGCRVGVHRSLGVEHFYTTSRAEATCCGMHAEFYDFYFLYAASAPGTVPLYRCYDPARGRHTYTTRMDCEGRGHVEGAMGYIGTSGSCGAVPLYRLYRAANDDTFYTTSASERDYAMTLGYMPLELAGYVWTAPRG